MDKKKIKLIIAREGLVILCLLVSGIVLYFLGNFLQNKYAVGFGKDAAREGIDFQPLWEFEQLSRLSNGKLINLLSVYIILGGYPFYLLIRFICWAIRILKEK